MKEYTVKVFSPVRQEWYLDGKRHRIDGPAYINGNCQKWYLDGVEMTEGEHKRRTSPAKELTIAEISKLLGYEVKIVK